MPRRTREDRQGGKNLASCSLELVSIATGTPDAEEDGRGSPRRKAGTTIDTATAEEDVKDCDCACASSRTCLRFGTTQQLVLAGSYLWRVHAFLQ